MQRRIVRRAVIAVAVVIAVVASTSWTLADLGSRWHHDPNSGGPPSIVRAFGLLFLLGLGVFITRRVRRAVAPIADVMAAADQVAAGGYDVHIEPRGHGETRNLAVSFNKMVERLRVNETQRRALFADIAHELRTPLAIIQGNVEGMLDGVYERDDAQFAPILEATRVMARLLEDLRTLSVAEARQLRLDREPVDPALLVHDVAAAFRPRAEERGISLTAEAQPVPEVELDPMRIRQVLDNLVANALRYAPEGGWVSIAAEHAGDGVRFSVTDNGPGIPPEQLAHIFDRFVKSAGSGGSGLGLAIAKSLVEAHGGTISAESIAGAGAVFRFTIPR